MGLEGDTGALGGSRWGAGLRTGVRSSTDAWWLHLVLGIAAVVVGVVLILDLVVAVTTLALLVGLSLLSTGLLDLLDADRFSPRWLGYLSGVLFVAAGIAAMVWPGVTLWAVAVVAGVGLLVGGVARVLGAIGLRDLPGWWLPFVGGLVSTVAGVLALAWPGATILVLAILLGIRALLFGAAEISLGLWLRRIRQQFA